MIEAVFAQFKFVATYLVPGAWPSIMIAFSTLLGGVTSWLHLAIDPIHGTEWPFVLNVLFWLLVLNAIAGLVYTTMRIFGRKPPLNQVLSGLVSSKFFEDYREEQRLRCVGLEKQISDARHSFDEVRMTDLKRIEQTFEKIFGLGEQRDKDVGRLRDTISRLQERTENHIRKLDQYDTKMDNLLREVSKAAARGVREAQGD